MATLEQILGFRNLTGVIQGIKGGVPMVLPPEFMTPGKQVHGNRGEYYRITGTRQTARIVQYGSPASRRELKDLNLIPVTLLHTLESQQWPLAMTIALTKMDSLELDKNASQQAEYQTREFKRRFSNLRITAANYALLQGKIYYSGTGTNAGEILPSSTASGVTPATTIDFGVPANNQNQLNGLIGTLWNQATAPIMTQLQQLQTVAAKTTGYPIAHAFYDDTVPGFISTNTEAQQYLIRNPAMNNHYITTGTIPDGFGGIAKWHSVGKAFYDYNGTNIKIGNANGVVFTPEYDPEWFEVMEGSFPVPATIMPQMGGDATTALKNVVEQYGMFGYGQLTLNPPTVEQFAGDTFLPVLKVPAAIFQAVVA